MIQERVNTFKFISISYHLILHMALREVLKCNTQHHLLNIKDKEIKLQECILMLPLPSLLSYSTLRASFYVL